MMYPAFDEYCNLAITIFWFAFSILLRVTFNRYVKMCINQRDNIKIIPFVVNSSYMIIAANFFIVIYGRNRFRNIYAYVMRPMTLKRILHLVILQVTLTSAQVLPQYFLNKEAGVRFQFGLVNDTTVMAWRNEEKFLTIGFDSGSMMIIPRVLMGLQIIVTLILYCLVIYASVKSTTEANRGT